MRRESCVVLLLALILLILTQHGRAQNVPPDIEKTRAEISRILAEATKLKVEAEKLKVEMQKLQVEMRQLDTTSRYEFWRTLGQFFSGLTGVGAIIALIVSVWQNAQQRRSELRRRVEEEFSRLLQETSSGDAGIRSTAADRLRVSIAPGDRSPEAVCRRDDAIRRLVGALATEENAAVRWTITGVLELAGLDALKPLERLYTMLIEQLRTLMTSPMLTEERAKIVKTMQSALVACADIKHAVTREPLNLRGALLRCYRFTERNFASADLTGASLWQAEVWRCEFSRATLVNVDCWDAYAVETVFKDANLENCRFHGADIEKADFRGARNLDVRGFERTNWRKAVFDDPFRGQLESAFPASGTDPEGPGRSTCLHLD